MGRAIRTACYVIGIIIIIFGFALINEYYAEISTIVTVPHLTAYPYIGSVLVIIGALIIYLGYRTRSKPRISLSRCSGRLCSYYFLMATKHNSAVKSK